MSETVGGFQMPFSKILCFCLILWCIRYDSETVNANFIVSRVHFIVWCGLSKMSYNVERAHVAHLSSWAWGQPLDRSPAVAGTESDVFTFLSCHPLHWSKPFWWVGIHLPHFRPFWVFLWGTEAERIFMVVLHFAWKSPHSSLIWWKRR